MLAMFLTERGFDPREVATPSWGPDEVLVLTLACGICEGDVQIYRTRREKDLGEVLLGHEGTGIVTAVGRNVGQFAEGDLVTALGGAYAGYFVAQPHQLIKLPAGLDPLYALGEPIACCIHAGHRFGIRPGDRVAVVGCGFMGLICLQLARYQSAGVIYAIDPIAERREMAGELGATKTCHPETLEDQQQAFDVVIEAAGAQSALDLCGDLVKEHGRIILVGYHQSNGGLRTVNMQQWNYKAIDVVNGHVRRTDEKLEAMGLGIELLSQGYLTTQPLTTAYPLIHAEQAFQDLVRRKAGLFKAVLVPDTPSSYQHSGQAP
jgi:threonine dehydrogenase-like Zn-dependent dehydrogenase